MDDDSGWHRLLLEVWSEELRDTVVERLEEAAVGRWAWFARVYARPDDAPAPVTEAVHALILAGIRDETGADLDELGSQAAWECYTQVWDALSHRWADGGRLASVRLGEEAAVIEALGQLPPAVAMASGAAVHGEAIDPLWLRGRLRIDEPGLRRALAEPLPPEARAAGRRVLDHLEEPAEG